MRWKVTSVFGAEDPEHMQEAMKVEPAYEEVGVYRLGEFIHDYKSIETVLTWNIYNLKLKLKFKAYEKELSF